MAKRKEFEGFIQSQRKQEPQEEAQVVTESPVTAPELTEEEAEELREKQATARASKRGRGRERKWDRDDKGNPIRNDGYKRTSMIVNVELNAKLKEIAFRSSMTEKEVLEQAMRKAVELYEEKHGVVVPNPDNYKPKDNLFD